eukprot:UN10887
MLERIWVWVERERKEKRKEVIFLIGMTTKNKNTLTKRAKGEKRKKDICKEYKKINYITFRLFLIIFLGFFLVLLLNNDFFSKQNKRIKKMICNVAFV